MQVRHPAAAAERLRISDLRLNEKTHLSTSFLSFLPELFVEQTLGRCYSMAKAAGLYLFKERVVVFAGEGIRGWRCLL